MTPLARILLVEDVPGDARLIREMLRDGRDARFEVESVATLAQALRRLGLDVFDVLLVDLGLPDSQGLETFVRLHARTPRSAILVLTGNDDLEMAVRAVEAGAQDYLVKGEVTEAILRRSILYALERMRIAGDLKRREARYRRLVEEVRDGTWAVDRSGVTTYANRRMADLLGLPVEDLIGRSLVSFVADERVQEMRGYLERSRAGEAGQVEVELIRPDGGRVHALLDASPLKGDAADAAAGSLVSVRDITERHLSDEALRASEARYRALFETSPYGLLLVDAESGRIADANPFLEQLLGSGPGELVGKTLAEISASGREAEIERLCSACGGDRRVASGDAVLRRKDGTSVAVELSACSYVVAGRRVIQLGAREVEARQLAESAR